jgi:hypothetical protein
MRRVHLVRAALTAALLTATAVAAAPAGAGGPTSVLLSVPGAGRTASLYLSDPEYDELANLVGVSRPSGTFETDLSGGHEAGSGVTITWLIHDVDPWRVDRVYLGAKGGPWISTQIMDGSGSVWDGPVRWHRPADGERLGDLLDELGLGSAPPSADTKETAGAAEQDATVSPPAAAPDPAPAAAATSSAWPGRLGWSLGGLVGGALLMFGWTRRRVTQPASADPRPSLDGSAEVLAR